MKTSTMSLITATAALAVASVAAYSHRSTADGPPPAKAAPTTDETHTAPDTATAGAGLSGSMHFTDEHGNRRNPTAAEARAAAQAFQKDLARLAGRHKDKPNVRTLPNGAVAATVATSRLVLLTASENADGTLTYGHPTTDDDDSLSQPASDLPEM